MAETGDVLLSGGSLDDTLLGGVPEGLAYLDLDGERYVRTGRVAQVPADQGDEVGEHSVVHARPVYEYEA